MPIDTGHRGCRRRGGRQFGQFLEDIGKGLVVLRLVEPVGARKGPRALQDIARDFRALGIEGEDQPGKFGDEVVFDLLLRVVHAMRIRVRGEGGRGEAVFLGDDEWAFLDLEEGRPRGPQKFLTFLQIVDSPVVPFRQKPQMGLHQKPVLKLFGQSGRSEAISHDPVTKAGAGEKISAIPTAPATTSRGDCLGEIL